MSNDRTDTATDRTDPPTSYRDEQDQTFGKKAEERKDEAESSGSAPADDSRPAEPHAGGKA